MRRNKILLILNLNGRRNLRPFRIVIKLRSMKSTHKLNLSITIFKLQLISNSKIISLLMMQSWPKLNLMHRHNMIKLKKLKMMQLQKSPLKGMLQLIKLIQTLRLRLMLCKKTMMCGSQPHWLTSLSN